MRKIALLAATTAAAAALCAACGGSAPAPAGGPHPSSAAPHTASSGASGSGIGLLLGPPLPDPCKLVPLAAARAVVGDSIGSATEPEEGVCDYGWDDSDGVAMEIAIFPTSYSTRAAFINGKATPFNGLGHPAECGPTLALGDSLVAEISSIRILNVVGPSCSADGELARDVYSALAP